jgi:hypothetical protein
MKSIELRVPNAIENLTGAEQDRLLRTALRAAARQRAHELARERREALTHIRRYERKYGSTLAQFERKKLSGLDTAQAHEDYNDWFFWGTVLARAESAGAALLKLETVVTA